jgi:hypothetical protein
MTQKWKNVVAEKKVCIFYQNLQFSYPYASIKDAQATGEASSRQKRTSSTSVHDISLLYSIFVGNFALLDPDPATQIIADHDPKPWLGRLGRKSSG